MTTPPPMNEFDAREDALLDLSKENRHSMVGLSAGELEAAAMLMDMWYDPSDHTFNNALAGLQMIDPDTMKTLPHSDGTSRSRRNLVQHGVIGPKDGMYHPDNYPKR